MTKKNSNINNKQYILIESPVLQEINPVSSVNGKVRYTAILQKLNEVSSNGVLYKAPIIQKGIERISNFIERGSLVSEMDHPITTDIARILNIFYKNTCQKILEVSIEGNYVVGLCENTTNSRGQDLYNLIVNDKIPIGFSLRAVASTIARNGYKEARSDINIVTWDVVAKPSFFNCIIQEVQDHAVLSKVPIRESFEKLEQVNSEIILESCSGKSCVLNYDPNKPFLKTIKKLTNVYTIIDPDVIPKIVYYTLKDKLRKTYF